MSRWYALTSKNLKQNDAGPGVYFIRSVCKNGQPCVLPRLLRKDRNGLFYIGKTGGEKNAGLDWRIWCFWREAIGKPQSPHVAGVRYRKLLKRRFPIESLQYRYKRLRSSAAALREESKILKQYERRFGELPPVNRQR